MAWKNRWLKTAAAVMLAVPLGGCLMPSAVHPWIADSEASVVATLAGEWRENGGDALRIEPAGTGARLIARDGSREGLYEARCARIGGETFIDLVSAEENPATLRLPVHLVARVRLAEGRLELAFLSHEWLERALHDGRVHAAHETIEAGLVMTAPTHDLQVILSDWAHDDAAFDEPSVYTRVNADHAGARK